MKATQFFNIWDDEDHVHVQHAGVSIDGQPPGPASKVISTMMKNVEREMLKKFNLEQLGNLRQLVNEVIEEKIAIDDFDDAFDTRSYNESILQKANKEAKGCESIDVLQFPKFKSYGLTKDQVQEVMENYINYQFSKSIERLQTADEPYKMTLEVDILKVLTQLKDMYCVLYTHL